MNMRRRFGMSALAGIGLICLAGCQSPSGTDEMAASPAGSGAAGPPTEFEHNEKEQRWLDAIAGLEFDSGRGRITRVLGDDPFRAQQHYELGIAERNRNDPIAAIGHLRDALSWNPDFIDAWQAMGMAMHHEGREQWALASYRNVLDIRPDDANLRFEVAMLLWNESESQQAISEMDRVTKLDPNRWQAHERLAIWNYYTGAYGAAWEHVHQTRGLGRDVPAQFLALLQRQMPDPQGSIN